MVWIKWTEVCKDARLGGLAIKDLSAFNWALLCKWMWRFSQENDNL